MLFVSVLLLCIVLDPKISVLTGAVLCRSAKQIIGDESGEHADASSFLQVSKASTHGSKDLKRGVNVQKQGKWVDSSWGLCQDMAIAAKDPKSTLVVVRTHLPKKGIIDRMASWAKDLYHHPQLSMMLMTSVDDTHLNEPWRSQVDRRVKEIPKTIFHQTDMAHVMKEYPVWKETNFTHRAPPIKGLVWRPSGWDTHIEFVLLAVQQARRSGQLHDDSYVWVIEDDIGVCGNMSEFIASYGDDPTDFIATAGMQKAPWDWRHYWESSEAFVAKYPLGTHWHAAEHVERFSMRFLLHLDDLIRNHKVTAHSEMFPATVCKNSDKFTCSTLDKKNLFGPRYFEHVARVSEADWEKICPSTQLCHTPPMLAHSLKW